METGGTKVLDVGEADANWQLIRDKVVQERFGPSIIPVPFLEDAASYDLLAVLIKKPPLGQSLLCRQCCLVPVGPLESLLPGGGPTQELTHCTREYSARVRGESRYEETRLVDGALRHIRLALAGVHKKVAFLVLRPGAVALRPDLPWLRSQSSIYVVYEVFYASSLTLAVTQGAEHRCFLREQPLPVAFSCMKFALNHKGVLGSQKPMGHGLAARAAWVRVAVPETTVPAAPLPRENSAAASKCWRPLGRPLQTMAGKWPFKQAKRPKLGSSCSSLLDPERQAMTLPLLQSLTAESDTEE